MDHGPPRILLGRFIEWVEVSVCSHGVRQTGHLGKGPNTRVGVVEVGNCCLNHHHTRIPCTCAQNSTHSRPLSFSSPHVFVLVSCYSCVFAGVVVRSVFGHVFCLVCRSERCNMQTHRGHAKQMDALTHDHITTIMCQTILSPGVFVS